MATLILSAVGTAVGGPIGGAVGALLGRAVDTSIIGRPEREGPRLTELAVTTSSYGQSVPRVFGTMRLPGTIVWATELVESSTTSGGKGQPRTTTYSYAISFAVALSSRPVASIGRIWADGALLRGGAGDLKVGGTMRLYHGWGDEPVDPLIAADKGSQACAFRGLAYVVFENLELASFGNRIPALSFEVIGPDGALDLIDLLEGVALAQGSSLPLPGLAGFADQGGTRTGLIGEIARLYQCSVTVSSKGPLIVPPSTNGATPLPPAVIGTPGSDGPLHPVARRQPISQQLPRALRYYDPARDFQPSVQLAPAGGGGGAGEAGATIEFAGAFTATAAQARIAAIRRRALGTRDTLQYRIASPGPALAPAALVQRAGDAGLWQVRGWEWHAEGIDLQLERVVAQGAATAVADAGTANRPVDELPGAIVLRYFELPWDGAGIGDRPLRFAAISMAGTRAALALARVENEALIPLGIAARADAVQGTSLSALPPSPALVFEPDATIDIELAAGSSALQSVDLRALFDGANRLLLGGEILQFLEAVPLSGGGWRLSGLLRGRGGTEHHAAVGHAPGEPAILLDERLVSLGPEDFGELAAVAGVGSGEPAYAELSFGGATLRPLAPVHPARIDGAAPAGDPQWRWTRRARGAWRWLDGVEAPLNEEREAYRVGLGSVDSPHALWEVAEPRFGISSAEWSALASQFPEASLWVSQIGSHAVSLPTALPR